MTAKPETAPLLERTARRAPDPFRPQAFFLEQEPAASRRVVPSACILLTGKECPWRCIMCDLWKHTIKEPTPKGAIPAQIEYALAHIGTAAEQVKLYNSGSFFDSAAVPLSDYEAIARRVAFASNVVVESHPRLIGEKTIRFRDFLEGSLEVAVGLETVHPQVLPRLNKRASLADFARAGQFLRQGGIGMRAFILVQPPFMPGAAAVQWAVKSAEFAFDCGANAVSLIPTRPGTHELRRLMAAGEYSPPCIGTLEEAEDAVIAMRRGRAFADTWDLEQFSSCPACFSERKRRLELTNLTQQIRPKIGCSVCGGGC